MSSRVAENRSLQTGRAFRDWCPCNLEHWIPYPGAICIVPLGVELLNKACTVACISWPKSWVTVAQNCIAKTFFLLWSFFQFSTSSKKYPLFLLTLLSLDKNYGTASIPFVTNWLVIANEATHCPNGLSVLGRKVVNLHFCSNPHFLWKKGGKIFGQGTFCLLSWCKRCSVKTLKF